MKSETLRKIEINRKDLINHVKLEIENNRKKLILKFESNSNRKSITERIITLKNQMMIRLKVEITYVKVDEYYGIKTIEIKKFGLFDSSGYRISLGKAEGNLLEDVAREFIIADI